MTSFTPAPGTQRLLRDALGNFATGVTVVTANGPLGPCGITANSFSGVSLDPALVMWAVDKASDRVEVFTNATHSAIHVMAAHQLETALLFARDGQAFDEIDSRLNTHSVPLLEDCLSRFECETVSAHDAGDHVILILRVMHATLHEGAPLIFKRGRFGDFSPRD